MKESEKMGLHIRAIAGRVSDAGNGESVHGLLLRSQISFGTAWDVDAACTFPLGCDLTDQEGRYWLSIDSEAFSEECRCLGHPRVHIEVLDRDGYVIHALQRDVEECPPSEVFELSFTVDGTALTGHRSRTLSWVEPSGPLRPAGVIDDIEEAFEVLVTEAEDPSLKLPGLRCATPALTVFDYLLADAWGALQGDLDSAARYRDMLSAVCARSSTGCCTADSPIRSTIESVLDEPCEADPCEPVKRRAPAACCCNGPACPVRHGFVSDDHVLILAMAALHVSCGHTETQRAYLIAVIDQICRFQFLAALHRAAVDTICGKPGAKAHFRDLLEWLACACTCGCGADDVATCDGLGCCQSCLPSEWLDCIRDAYRNWCALECFTVCDVVPPRACPGETLVLCGCSFGNQPGRIRFNQYGSMLPGPEVEPLSWTDDRISVVIPQGAGCGLTVVPPLLTLSVCDRFIDVRRSGMLEREFEGTGPEILSFVIKGHLAGDCIRPGERLRIRWKTCAADHVVVRIIDEATGATIASQDPAPARGRWDFADTEFTTTTRLRVQIVATGICEPRRVTREISIIVQEPAHLTIDGVEVTQAIQYYRAASHLTDASDRGPDNSLQLVANKSAWVRTYLRSGQDPAFDNGQLANVSGTLTIERRVGGVWSVVANLAPVNGPITAEDSFASYNAERRDINVTLNFVIPAATMNGLLRLTIHVSSPDDCTHRIATTTQLIDIDLDQQLRIAAVAIGYNGPPIGGGANVVFAAPTTAAIAAEASLALRVYPVRSTPNVRVIDTQNATQPLNNNTFPAGGCDPNWTPILNLVANARTNDGNQAGWFYYGFVTPSIPISHGNVGCANGGNGAGLLGTGTTMAHEVGHQSGLNHAPCGAVGTVTPGFPLYEPYDTGVTSTDSSGNTVYQDASIGEYGLDINDGTVFNPNPAQPNNGKDLMGYCGNRWVALFTYTFMTNNGRLNPVALATGTNTAGQLAGGVSMSDPHNRVRPFITLLGHVARNNEVTVSSLVRVPTRELTMTGARTGLVAELVGDDGEVAASAPVFTLGEHEGTGCGCGGGPVEEAEAPYSFIAAVPNVAEGSAVRICDGDTVLWERKRPRARLSLRSAQASVQDDRLQVSWSFDRKPSTAPEVWLRWSEDGLTWSGLAVGLSGGDAAIDLSAIPAPRASIQVVAHDGFRSVTAETEAVDLPATPPSVAIVHPEDGQGLRTGTPLHLWGAPLGQTSTSGAAWYVDGTEVGTGFDTWIAVPEPGTHSVELRSEDGAHANAQIVVTTD
jgi:hypothetical protein